MKLIFQERKENDDNHRERDKRKHPAFFQILGDENEYDREEEDQGRAHIDETGSVDAPVDRVEFVDKYRKRGMI